MPLLYIYIRTASSKMSDELWKCLDSNLGPLMSQMIGLSTVEQSLSTSRRS